MNSQLPKELIFDLVLIKPDPPQENNVGGIYSGEPKISHTGEVIMTGKGKQAEDTGLPILMQVFVGDRVWFDAHGATVYMDTEYLIMEQGYCKSKI